MEGKRCSYGCEFSGRGLDSGRDKVMCFMEATYCAILDGVYTIGSACPCEEELKRYSSRSAKGEQNVR